MKKILLLLGLLSLLVINGCSVSRQQEQTATPPETTVTIKRPAIIYHTDSYGEIADQTSSIGSRYITDRYNVLNHFYIDEQKILWGTGKNHYWQLGIQNNNDRNNLDADYSTPVKIAEKVVHVDASDNGYFVIFLTGDHRLYGLGANTEGILRQPVKEFEELNFHQNISAEPVLLMENVLYASAGRKSIAVLTKDFDVWWWGKFKSATAVNKVGAMFSEEPRLMVKNAKYTVCGADMAAAIDQDNNLWTWGNNVWGQCGLPEGDDYIKEARLVCNGIDMVWPDMLNSKQNLIPDDELPDINPYESITYPYTTFIRKTDGKIYACGINLGTEDKTVSVYGGIAAPDQDDTDMSGYTFKHSSDFVEIEVKPLEKGKEGYSEAY